MIAIFGRVLIYTSLWLQEGEYCPQTASGSPGLLPVSADGVVSMEQLLGASADGVISLEKLLDGGGSDAGQQEQQSPVQVPGRGRRASAC
jgi:hypothetical protein